MVTDNTSASKDSPMSGSSSQRVPGGGKPRSPQKSGTSRAKITPTRSTGKTVLLGNSRPHQVYSLKCNTGVALFITKKAHGPGNPNAREDAAYNSFLNDALMNQRVLRDHGANFICARRRIAETPVLEDIALLTSRNYPWYQIVALYPVIEEMTDESIATTGRSLARAMTQFASDDRYPSVFKYVGDRTVLTEDGGYPAPGLFMFNQETLNIMDSFYPIGNQDPVLRAEALAMDFFGRETQDVIDLIVNGVAFEPPVEGA